VAAPPAPKPRPIDDRRVAVIQFERLDRQQRRRLRRWIARQPVGAVYPLHQLRPGTRLQDHDFLDVAIAECPPLDRERSWQTNPLTYARTQGWRLTRALDLTVPHIACSHDRGRIIYDFGGAMTTMYELA
jgi:hypothetical protein